MKRVLVIAYIFPPIGGSGVQRTTKFVKYLPQMGWCPLIVSGDNGDVFKDGIDTSLLTEIPSDLKVWRAPFRSPIFFRRWIQDKFGVKPLTEGRDGAGKSNGATRQTESVQAISPLRRLAQLLSAPLAPFEYPPVDAALYWALSIIPFCRKLITREKIDLIFTTSFPYSDHVAGYLLKRLTGKPWVADFRDPWTQNAFSGNIGWRRKWDEFVEQKVLHFADKAIGVTPSYTQGLRNLARDRQAENFITIENGFDQADFAEEAGTHPQKQNGTTTIAHVGFLYDGAADPIRQSLDLLRPVEKSRLRILFIGGADAQVKEMIHQPGVQIEWLERVPHPRAIQFMRTSDIVLLLIGGEPAWYGHYPGKLFEYMACGTPILMVGPEGDAARLVRDSGTGCFCPVDEITHLSEILALLAANPEQFRDLYYHPNEEVIARYERCRLTGRLADVFNEITA